MIFDLQHPRRTNEAWVVRHLGTGALSILVLLISSLWSPTTAHAQTGSIQGVVRSADDGDVLEGANVWVMGTNLSTVTDVGGSFTLGQVPPGSHLLKTNLMGFAEITVEVEVRSGDVSSLEISLPTSPFVMDAITVTGSRRLEKLTDAPASISLVTGDEMARTVSLNYAENLQGTRGVDSYRGGVEAVVVNARGFTTAYNYRLRVMVDNKNGHFPALGIPAGSLFPLIEEDIDRMEVVLGPSSALYGPNAHNGLLHIITKHPRDYPGTTLVAGGGSNSILFGRVRHAGGFEKFAYKFSADYLTGKDWTKSDTLDQDNSGRFYLDEAGEDLEILRTSGSLYYSPSQEVQIVGSLGYSHGSTPITMNTGRGYGLDASLNYQELRVETPRFFAQAYRLGNDLGDTHAIEAKIAALVLAANEGSPISETEAISRARTIEKGYRMNYEAQYNDGFVFSGVEFRVITGIQHEDMRPNTEGTLFTEGRVEPSDPVTGRVRLRQTGVYGQIEADLNERWRLVFAGRYDTHSKYEAQTSPRAAVVYRIPGKGSFRFTYNRAFQAPEIISLELLREAGVVPGTSIPVVVRGNGDGFLLSDSTWVPPLTPERNTTYEVGYKGILSHGLFVDVNLYHSRYENFLTPLVAITDPATGVSPITLGDKPLLPWPNQYVLAFRNFGQVNLNGLDLGLTYQFNDRTSGWLNYSFMSHEDLDGPEFDLNSDGKFQELSFNAPENKVSAGVGIADLFREGLFGAVSARWVQEYDFLAGVHSATKAGKGTGSGLFKDRGPLGGFTTFDVNLSYTLNPQVQLNFSATNIFDEGHRETVGSPLIRRLIRAEVKYTIR